MHLVLRFHRCMGVVPGAGLDSGMEGFTDLPSFGSAYLGGGVALHRGEGDGPLFCYYGIPSRAVHAILAAVSWAGNRSV